MFHRILNFYGRFLLEKIALGYLVTYLIDRSLMIKFSSKPALYQTLISSLMMHTFVISFLQSASHIPPLHLSLPVLSRGHPILDDHVLIAVA